MRLSNNGRQCQACLVKMLVLVITMILLVALTTVSYTKLAQSLDIRVGNPTNTVGLNRFAVSTSLWSDDAQYTRHVLSPIDESPH